VRSRAPAPQISEPVRNAQERLQLQVHAARLVRAPLGNAHSCRVARLAAPALRPG